MIDYKVENGGQGQNRTADTGIFRRIALLAALLLFSVEVMGASNMADAGMSKNTKGLKKLISKGADVNFQDEGYLSFNEWGLLRLH